MQMCLGQLNCKTAVKIRIACYSKQVTDYVIMQVFASLKIVLSVDANVLVCTAEMRR